MRTTVDAERIGKTARVPANNSTKAAGPSVERDAEQHRTRAASLAASALQRVADERLAAGLLLRAKRTKPDATRIAFRRLIRVLEAEGATEPQRPRTVSAHAAAKDAGPHPLPSVAMVRTAVDIRRTR